MYPLQRHNKFLSLGHTLSYTATNNTEFDDHPVQYTSAIQIQYSFTCLAIITQKCLMHDKFNATKSAWFATNSVLNRSNYFSCYGFYYFSCYCYSCYCYPCYWYEYYYFCYHILAPLPATGCQLPQLLATSYRLPATGYRLPATGYWLRRLPPATTGYRLQEVAGGSWLTAVTTGRDMSLTATSRLVKIVRLWCPNINHIILFSKSYSMSRKL